MTSEEYPEFEALNDIENDVDKVAYLLKIAKRYTTVADLARQRANALLTDSTDVAFSSTDGTTFTKVSKTTRKVDVDALRLAHPELYQTIIDNCVGVSISAKVLKDTGVDDVFTTTTSTYFQLDH